MTEYMVWMTSPGTNEIYKSFVIHNYYLLLAVAGCLVYLFPIRAKKIWTITVELWEVFKKIRVKMV